jgi:hypothetical protein
MYNSEGRLGQEGDGEASVNVYIYKRQVILFFSPYSSSAMIPIPNCSLE